MRTAVPPRDACSPTRSFRGAHAARPGDELGRGADATLRRGDGSSSLRPPTPPRGSRRSPAHLGAAESPLSDGLRRAIPTPRASSGAWPSCPRRHRHRWRTSASSRSMVPCSDSSPRPRSFQHARYVAPSGCDDGGPGVCRFSLKWQRSVLLIGSQRSVGPGNSLHPTRSSRPALLRGPASSIGRSRLFVRQGLPRSMARLCVERASSRVSSVRRRPALPSKLAGRRRPARRAGRGPSDNSDTACQLTSAPSDTSGNAARVASPNERGPPAEADGPHGCGMKR